ncbi:Beta-ketoacyl synthase, partial [Kibdelosporangium sp. 4NS15]|nr:Beta-ketoacyl synthase [Kibdelosporangium persicum]
MGHSVGEVVAAHVAGVLSLADACVLVAARGRLMEGLPSGGAMAAVRASEDEVRPLLSGRVGIAAVNGPESVVVSGADEDVTRIETQLAGRGRRTRRMRVSHAFHSPLMEPMMADFAAVAAGLSYGEPTIPVVSTLTGRLAGDELRSPDYWVRHVRAAVRFGEGMETLLTEGVRTFLDLGPDGVLTALGRDCVPGDRPEIELVASARAGRGEETALVTALTRLHVRGVPVDWAAFFSRYSPRRVDLPTYAFQRKRFWAEAGASSARPEADSWRYRVQWRPRTLAATPPPAGKWLVVAPADGVGDDRAAAVVRGLELAGADVESLVLDPAEGDPAARLAGRELDGVLSLLALRDAPRPETPGMSLAVSQTLTLIRALGDAGVSVPLWVATAGGVVTGQPGEILAPAQAMVWGMGIVAALEHPGRWGGLVDLPQDVDDASCAALAAVLVDPGGEDQVAIRQGGVYARRLVPAPARGGPATSPWRPRGTVLVTGGTGGVGAEVARWLAANGAEHVVLVSRRGPAAPGAAELESGLAALGARVTVAAGDVADRDDLAALLERVEADGPPVRAVVHAAGVVEMSAPLEESTVEDFAGVVAAKVAGAVQLDELLADRPLDAFVLFSSVAGVWGGGGQAAYAAGNAFLDAFAQWRRIRGRVATSIAWGAWAGRGATAHSATEDFLARRGVRGMPAGSALSALQRALDDDETFIAVADVDWERFAAGFTSSRRSRLLAELPTAPRTGDRPVAGPSAAVRERLLGLPPGDRGPAALDLVRERAAAVLGHAGPDVVEPDRALRDLGFDSLTVVELRDTLAAVTGLGLPSTLAFDFPTARALAEHIAGELTGYPADMPSAPQAAVRTDEPVAIVGMACRFPGGIGSPEELWRLLADEGEAVSGLPSDRGWEVSGFTGGFLAGAGDFDAGFFGVSPREALAMDPQQRLLLETSWEVFERAGIDPVSRRGTDTGVFVGCANQGYASSAELPDDSGYRTTGGAGSVVSGRVAYVFGLEGPAITVDTACSSSLVALHLAARSLADGECSLAIAGGVTVMSNPDAFTEFERQGGLASDGRCKAFAAAADGTAWGEGVGVLLVERLSDARRNGHRVLAVVRGSAVNSDGASNGLTAPSGRAQRRVIGQALAVAGLEASDVDVVEAHGTGTRLGDPIEARALLATYGQGRERPLWLGSVKSNIGHTQSASGVAGVIKMVLAMRHGVVPRTLHVDEPSPHVDWSAGSVRLLTEAKEWPRTGRPRRAGVSSFGISGTNAHVI